MKIGLFFKVIYKGAGMKLDVFEFVERTSQAIEEKNNEVKLASRYLRTFFMELLKGREELISV